MNILAIIPAYNEGEKIGEVVSGLKNKANLPLDILVVNDGSKDETASRAVEDWGNGYFSPSTGTGALSN